MLSKRRKLRQRTRRQISVVIILIVLLVPIAGPFIWRLERLRQAESMYNFTEVNEDLQWLAVHGGLLNKLELIKDARSWLDLNLGNKGLESELMAYQDEKHQFWLFLLYLQEGKQTEAQNVIKEVGNTPLSQLEKGLIALVNGDAEEARRLLAETSVDWGSLRNINQSLRHLTLAKAAILLGDYQTSQAELKFAQQLDPYNPACLSVEFDVALGERQWAKANDLCHTIDAQTWRPQNSLFETKKAILAIHEKNASNLSESLAALNKLPQGEACIKYVNGIEDLQKGHLQEGKSLLASALESGLNGGLKTDAQKAIEQINERQKADQHLRSVGDGNLE